MKCREAWNELKAWVAEEGFRQLERDASPMGKALAARYRIVLDKINELEEKHE